MSSHNCHLIYLNLLKVARLFVTPLLIGHLKKLNIRGRKTLKEVTNWLS
jgi:hypothetical protein